MVLSEAELAKELRERKSDAITQLYNTYVDRVYSLVYNQVDCDRDTAEEIVQETFYAAIKSASSFQGRSGLLTWLCSIANNKVADHYRRKKRETDKKVMYAEYAQQNGHGHDVTTAVESMENVESVKKALSALPLHYKQVLILKYVEGFSLSDISQMMLRSQKSVEGLITRARREMQDRLGVAGGEQMRDNAHPIRLMF